MKRVAICIPTYRRPLLLIRLLNSLQRATVPAGLEIEVRVVDNDAEGSARSAVDTYLQTSFSALPVSYALEPEPNISCARNRAVDMGPADALLFIDDDEHVEPDCLTEMLRQLTETGADAVVGWVAAELPDQAPRWLRQGGFLDHPTGRSGSRLPWNETRCGCTLIRGRWFYEEQLRFDPEYGRSGGEDSDLFFRMAERGATVVAAPEARAWEHVPPDRMSLAYLCRRQWRTGMSFHRMHDIAGSRRRPAIRFIGRVARAGSRLVLGLPLMLVGSSVTVVRGVLDLCLAGGGLMAWLRPEVARADRSYGAPVSAPMPSSAGRS